MNRIMWTLSAVIERARRGRRRLLNWWSLQTARLAKPASAFVSQPDPRSYGLAARGVQMVAGNFLVAGEVVELGEAPIWDLSEGSAEYLDELHGFAWLDDLAAADTPAAREKAQNWMITWQERFGTQSSVGWSPDITGRRVVRWINHALVLLNRLPAEQSRVYFKSLGLHAHYLEKRWKSMPPGRPRIEALTGLVYCGLALEGKSHLLKPALKALGQECANEIAGDGSISSRNPEELVDVFTLLSWVNQAVSYTDVVPDTDLLLALQRMAPTIRALRLGDGGMVRFNGGGAGQSERVDQALADAGIREPAREGGAMGYTRVSSGGTLAIMDTGPMPPLEASENAHAGSLAFEVSSGRLPLLVNMGRSYDFKDKVRDACRASAAHNTLVVDQTSSALFANDGFVGRTFGRRLISAAKTVTVSLETNSFGVAILASHDGYSQSHGLIHTRQLAILENGRVIQGEDTVVARTTAQKVRFSRAARSNSKKRIPIRLHFRVHPDVEAELDLQGRAVSLKLLNGEVWVFQTAMGRLALKRATYMEKGRMRPRATKQIVVTGAAIDYEGAINWSLSRPI